MLIRKENSISPKVLSNRNHHWFVYNGKKLVFWQKYYSSIPGTKT